MLARNPRECYEALHCPDVTLESHRRWEGRVRIRGITDQLTPSSSTHADIIPFLKRNDIPFNLRSSPSFVLSAILRQDSTSKAYRPTKDIFKQNACHLSCDWCQHLPENHTSTPHQPVNSCSVGRPPAEPPGHFRVGICNGLRTITMGLRAGLSTCSHLLAYTACCSGMSHLSYEEISGGSRYKRQQVGGKKGGVSSLPAGCRP